MKEINRMQVLETLEKALRDAIECEDTLTFSVAIDGETGEAYEWNCVCPLDCPESVYKGKDIQIVRFEAEKYSVSADETPEEQEEDIWGIIDNENLEDYLDYALDNT